MSNFTLGRIGLDADINDVSMWDSAGETVTVAFSTPMIAEGGSLARSNAYRQMLLGYAESPDQRFVPLTWADDPTADGYYRVRSVSVSPDPDLALDALYYYTATLERVQGYGMPAIQTTYLFKAKANFYNAGGSAFLALPSGDFRAPWHYTYEPEDGTYTNQPNQCSMAVSDQLGAVDNVLAQASGGSGPSSGELSLWVRAINPDAYYVGAARIEVGGYPVEGRQVPRNWEHNWRISNGSVELKMHADGIANDEAIFQMSGWSGGAWNDPIPVTLLGDGSFTTPRDPFRSPTTMTILKNTAEEVIVRFALLVPNRRWPMFFDITLRRGDRTFTCRLRRTAGTGSAFPAFTLPNHLFDYGWRREGARVSAGVLINENLIWNPRAIDDGTHWDRYNNTGTATGRITGEIVSSTGITTAFRATASGAHGSDTFGVEHGLVGMNTPNNGFSNSTQYTFSAWVRSSVARTVFVRVRWRNSSGNFLAASDSSNVALAANTWTQITLTATSPASSTSRVSMHVTGNPGGVAWSAGQTLDMTGLQGEEGATVDPFWDGDNNSSDLIIAMYATPDGPNTRSKKYDRTNLPTYWFTSIIETQEDTDGWEPVLDPDPATWDFGFGMMGRGTTGDAGRFRIWVNGYFMSLTQSDDVVAI